jgi:hypothetical protein
MSYSNNCEFLPNSITNYYRGASHAIADTAKAGRAQRLAESRVRRMVARGLLSHIRVNGRLLLPETAIEDYVANHFVAAAGRSTPIGRLTLASPAQDPDPRN